MKSSTKDKVEGAVKEATAKIARWHSCRAKEARPRSCRFPLSPRFFPVPYIRVPDAIILFLGITTIPSRM